MKKIVQVVNVTTPDCGRYSTVLALTEDGKLYTSQEICLFSREDIKTLEWSEIPKKVNKNL